MKEYKIPCECGGGLKLFLKASQIAKNPGRFYYCCPNDNAGCSFIWADQVWLPKYRHLHIHITERDENNKFPGGSPVDQPGFRSRKCNVMQDDTGKSMFDDSTIKMSHIKEAISPPSTKDASYLFKSQNQYSTSSLGFLCCVFGSICFVFGFVMLMAALVIVAKN